MKWPFVLIMIALSVPSVVSAEERSPGSLALGVHGLGTQWSYGRPTLRWKYSDRMSFDFTPVATLDDTTGHGNSFDSNGVNDGKSSTYGLNVGLVRQLRTVAGFSLGWRTEIGYTYGVQEYRSAYSSPQSGTSASSGSQGRWRDIEFGFGPDAEYFVAAVPGLSIGASAQIHCRYTSQRYHYQTTSSGYMLSGSVDDTSRRTTLSLIGELLTLRYYY